nr:endonuclease/exonuclease/phosphatase family protein [Bacteroidota bacterium]
MINSVKILNRTVLYIVILLGVLVILASLLSLIQDLSYWYLKLLDFPRLQYLTVALICLLVFIGLNKRWGYAAIFLCLGLLGAFIIQSVRILPYVIGEKIVPDGDASALTAGNIVGIMIANVLISNRQAEDFLQIVKDTDPDMLVAMEVDQWWMNALEPLHQRYPHRMEYPTDNAYGMVLYSRFPLE